VFEDALYAIRSAKSAGFLVAGIYDESAFDDADEIKSLVDFYLNSYDQWKTNFI
jgi:beta-phosphoglucomutase-like phosphatase (HAD superfamily)